MGVLRTIYVIVFPLAFTVFGLVLSLITFFGSYEGASALRNINYMSLDLGNISVAGHTSSEVLNAANASSVYSIGTNGWCSGNSTGNMGACQTPHEPFYFTFEDVLEKIGLSDLESTLPQKLKDYNKVSKAATLGLWGCFLAAICLSFLGGVCGIFAGCSDIFSGFAKFFVTLAFFAAALGAALGTGVYATYKHKINDLMGAYGIKASLNSTGLGIAWGSAAAFLIADFLFTVASCCSGCGGSRRRAYESVPEKNGFV